MAVALLYCATVLGREAMVRRQVYETLLDRDWELILPSSDERDMLKHLYVSPH